MLPGEGTAVIGIVQARVVFRFQIWARGVQKGQGSVNVYIEEIPHQRRVVFNVSSAARGSQLRMAATLNVPTVEAACARARGLADDGVRATHGSGADGPCSHRPGSAATVHRFRRASARPIIKRGKRSLQPRQTPPDLAIQKEDVRIVATSGQSESQEIVRQGQELGQYRDRQSRLSQLVREPRAQPVCP